MSNSKAKYKPLRCEYFKQIEYYVEKCCPTSSNLEKRKSLKFNKVLKDYSPVRKVTFVKLL